MVYDGLFSAACFVLVLLLLLASGPRPRPPAAVAACSATSGAETAQRAVCAEIIAIIHHLIFSLEENKKLYGICRRDGKDKAAFHSTILVHLPLV